MYKHELSKKQVKTQKKSRKGREIKKKGYTQYLKQNLSKLDFDYSPQSNLFTNQ